ncbi:MAG: 4Fe-4S binding protein [Proteobacteria bacterium]|nr:4Fe-4S binding protein [Pseudomonadota bacterium]
MVSEFTVYEKLRQQLDQYSCGYPATRSGVELRILQKLFTEEEAEMFLQMSLSIESPEEVARRTGRDPEAVAALLGRMADRGLLFRWRRDDRVKYGAAAFVLGLYEFQLNRMDRELAELFEQYFEEALLDSMTRVDPLMRTVPVNRSFDVSHPVATYDDARAMVKRKKLIGLANCICRLEQGLVDKGCGKPLEVCIQFGSSARYFIDRGLAREITVEEALAVLDRSEEAGLVTQPGNARNPEGLCNCCGDCCGILRGLNKLDKPAEKVISSYFAVLDPEACLGCEVCLERCQMGAIEINDATGSRIDPDRCIGCGLCVTTCSGEAIRLELKPEGVRRMPPETGIEAQQIMSEVRGTSLTPLFGKS